MTHIHGVTRQTGRMDLEPLHHAVAVALADITKAAEPHETRAGTILRLGPQHPLVRRFDNAVRAYRRAAPWNR